MQPQTSSTSPSSDGERMNKPFQEAKYQAPIKAVVALASTTLLVNGVTNTPPIRKCVPCNREE